MNHKQVANNFSHHQNFSLKAFFLRVKIDYIFQCLTSIEYLYACESDEWQLLNKFIITHIAVALWFLLLCFKVKTGSASLYHMCY